jgi:hypothetical protein
VKARARWTRAMWLGWGVVACGSSAGPPSQEVTADASGLDGSIEGSTIPRGKECFSDDAGEARDSGLRDAGPANVCGNGLCELFEDCRICCPDCACASGEVCTADGACGTPARCGIDWECGSGDSFGVFVNCGECPAGATCTFHACQ